jgi:aminopeptidase
MPSDDIAPFNLKKLLTTIFHPKDGERVGVFIDLENPKQIKDLPFLGEPAFSTRRIAYEVFYQGLLSGKDKLPLGKTEFFAYEPTGGSNLDLPDQVYDLEAKEKKLVDVLKRLDIVLYLSTFSATAPLTAMAKEIGFRGATMHGCNETILKTGLSQDYDQVSARAERFRLAVTRCEKVVIEYIIKRGGRSPRTFALDISLDGQEAQKSHGLCRTPGEIANLPAGEIYWVPTGAEGRFPMKFKEDGTIGSMFVREGRIQGAELISGDSQTLRKAMELYLDDPATGKIGELGLGTQELPFSGRDIQDEKVLGTFHIATGRSDHLGGNITPDQFKDKRHATHEDILFAPHKTAEITVLGVTMHKAGKEELLIENYHPTDFVRKVAL